MDADDRRPQHDRLAELGRHGVGDLPDPAFELGVLVATRHRHQRLNAARRSRQEEPVEERDLGEVGGEARPHRRRDQVAGEPGRHVRRAEPGLHRLRVPVGRLRRVPRRLDGHLLGHGVHARNRLPRTEQRHRAHPGDVAPVAADPAAGGQHVVALDVRLEGGDAHLLGQRVHAVVVRADEAAAHVDGHAVPAGLRPHPSADAVPRLEDDHRAAGLAQAPRRRQPGQPRPDDADVGLPCARPGPGSCAHGPSSLLVRLTCVRPACTCPEEVMR